MVEEIHLEGGTILGTSRGLPNVPEIVKRLGARMRACGVGSLCAALLPCLLRVCLPPPACMQQRLRSGDGLLRA